LDRRLEKGRGMRCLHNGNVCRQPKTAAKNKFAYLDEEESENCIKYFPGQMSESKSQKGAAKKWQKIKNPNWQQEMHFKAFGHSQCLPN